MKSQNSNNENITSAQAIKLIQEHKADTNFVILDVRTPEEYKSGHLEKAVLINFNSPDFKEKITELDKNKTYLVYCRRGGRSAEAVKIMKEQGFSKIFHLFEGILVWEDNGYKTVKE